MNDTGRGAVEIKPCGEGVCGHVVWVKDPADTKGCGRQIIGDAKPAGEGLWDNGWIYSPERKKKYDVELKPLADGTLRVKGYAGTKLFSKTMIWTPAPADLVRCGGEQVAAKAPTAGPAQESLTVVKAATVEELKMRTKTAPAEGSAKIAEAAPAPAAETPAANADPKAAPAPQAGEQEVAADESGEAEGSDLADKLGEFLKKDGKGNCKLDLPWVKIDFQCDGSKK
jgi:hypothetical protein